MHIPLITKRGVDRTKLLCIETSSSIIVVFLNSSEEGRPFHGEKMKALLSSPFHGLRSHLLHVCFIAPFLHAFALTFVLLMKCGSDGWKPSLS
ncbi:hypothetical protein E1A91_A09G170400v1 [Gossypium mustelinum]|uniref:Uncharacterized protein n=1 Tax=Gossypium mustelinum TaxID=34275 RepID=A0A5D2XYV6_GOSMU|nr:hypothetical protein E1A91_A09G170400v1 [Gossypium mustelinum]